MWLFTRYGFYSIACASKHDGALDLKTLMIRSRLKAHLEKLQARFPRLSGAEIFTSPIRDYRYRILVDREVWEVVVAELVKEQTWSNFKNEVATFGGGDEYVRALHEVWHVMHRLQRRGGSDE